MLLKMLWVGEQGAKEKGQLIRECSDPFYSHLNLVNQELRKQTYLPANIWAHCSWLLQQWRRCVRWSQGDYLPAPRGTQRCSPSIPFAQRAQLDLRDVLWFAWAISSLHFYDVNTHLWDSWPTMFSTAIFLSDFIKTTCAVKVAVSHMLCHLQVQLTPQKSSLKIYKQLRSCTLVSEHA